MLTALLPQSLYFWNRYKFCILRSKGTQCIEHEYHYDGTYNVNVNVFFFICEKGRYRLKSLNSIQSRSVTPSLDTPSGARFRASQFSGIRAKV